MKLKRLLETISIRTPWAVRMENNLDPMYDSRPILAAFALFFVIACWLLLS